MKVLLICVALVATVWSAKLPLREVEQRAKRTTTTWKPQPYNFGFEVRDENTTNYQNRAEVSDEFGRVKGSYSYVLPDGFVYTFTYEDNRDGKGLKTVVKKEPSGIQVIIPEPKPANKKKNLVQKVTL